MRVFIEKESAAGIPAHVGHMHSGGHGKVAGERLGFLGAQPEAAAHAQAPGADGAARLEAPLQFVYNDKAHGQALPVRDQRIEKRKKVRSAPQGEHSNLQNEIKQKKAWIPWHSLFSEIFEIENPSLSGCS